MVVSDHETLAQPVAEVGLGREEVLTMLRGDTYAAEVRAEARRAQLPGRLSTWTAA